MEKLRILLIEVLKIIFLTGSILYFFFGILSICHNKELLERIGTKIKIHVAKEIKDEKEIEKKVSLFVSLQFFFASIIDLILMIIIHIIIGKKKLNSNKTKENNDNSFNFPINDSIENYSNKEDEIIEN